MAIGARDIHLTRSHSQKSQCVELTDSGGDVEGCGLARGQGSLGPQQGGPGEAGKACWRGWAPAGEGRGQGGARAGGRQAEEELWGWADPHRHGPIERAAGLAGSAEAPQASGASGPSGAAERPPVRPAPELSSGTQATYSSPARVGRPGV